MTNEEIIDELNAGRLYGLDNWAMTIEGNFIAGTPDVEVRLKRNSARREAEAIRRKRAEIDLEPIMPLLDRLAEENHIRDIGFILFGKCNGVTGDDVRAVAEAWKARRQ